MSYEDNFLRNLDRVREIKRSRFDPVVEQKAMRRRTLKTLKLERFRGTFSDEKIDAALEYVANRKKEISRDVSGGEQGGFIFEGVMHAAIEDADWLGAEAQTLPVAEYDDLRNGVDLLVEYGSDASGYSHLALGLDVTYSVENVDEKIRAAVAHIKRGSLTMVEFFESTSMGLKGTLSNVPHVVVGVERDTVNELIEIFGKNDKNGLEKHISQFVILEQIKIQLEGFLGLIPRLSIRQERKESMMKKIQTGLERVRSIFESKRKIFNELFADERDYKKAINEDAVYRAISAKMEEYKPKTPSVRTSLGNSRVRRKL